MIGTRGSWMLGLLTQLNSGILEKTALSCLKIRSFQGNLSEPGWDEQEQFLCNIILARFLFTIWSIKSSCSIEWSRFTLNYINNKWFYVLISAVKSSGLDSRLFWTRWLSCLKNKWISQVHSKWLIRYLAQLKKYWFKFWWCSYNY